MIARNPPKGKGKGKGGKGNGAFNARSKLPEPTLKLEGVEHPMINQLAGLSDKLTSLESLHCFEGIFSREKNHVILRHSTGDVPMYIWNRTQFDLARYYLALGGATANKTLITKYLENPDLPPKLKEMAEKGLRNLIDAKDNFWTRLASENPLDAEFGTPVNFDKKYPNGAAPTQEGRRAHFEAYMTDVMRKHASLSRFSGTLPKKNEKGNTSFDPHQVQCKFWSMFTGIAKMEKSTVSKEIPERLSEFHYKTWKNPDITSECRNCYKVSDLQRELSKSLADGCKAILSFKKDEFINSQVERLLKVLGAQPYGNKDHPTHELAFRLAQFDKEFYSLLKESDSLPNPRGGASKPIRYFDSIEYEVTKEDKQSFEMKYFTSSCLWFITRFGKYPLLRKDLLVKEASMQQHVALFIAGKPRLPSETAYSSLFEMTDVNAKSVVKQTAEVATSGFFMSLLDGKDTKRAVSAPPTIQRHKARRTTAKKPKTGGLPEPPQELYDYIEGRLHEPPPSIINRIRIFRRDYPSTHGSCLWNDADAVKALSKLTHTEYESIEDFANRGIASGSSDEPEEGTHQGVQSQVGDKATKG